MSVDRRPYWCPWAFRCLLQSFSPPPSLSLPPLLHHTLPLPAFLHFCRSILFELDSLIRWSVFVVFFSVFGTLSWHQPLVLPGHKSNSLFYRVYFLVEGYSWPISSACPFLGCWCTPSLVAAMVVNILFYRVCTCSDKPLLHMEFWYLIRILS